MNRFLTILLVLTGLLQLTFAETPINKYLTEIPFLPKYVKPLLVLDIDYSGSMRFSAYYHGDCVYNLRTGWECYTNYNKTEDYYGYYNNTACYSYNSTGGYWYENDTCSCSDGVGTSDCVSGRLLNWLLTSRGDVLFKTLIGGRMDCDTTGGYCVIKHVDNSRVVYDNKLHCKFVLDEYYSRHYTVFKAEDYNGVCPVKFYYRYAYLGVPYTPPGERDGILQQIYNKVDITVFSFSSPRYPAGVGRIIYGYDARNNQTIEDLVNAIQSIYPGGYTYTGESLYEVEDYLMQENNHYYESNSAYINPGSEVDPYYVLDENGNLVPVPCRKVYVLLISDGEWNGNVDPKEPAYYLHTEDLRSDLVNMQKADVYTLYVFSTSNSGLDALATTSGCGAFIDLNGNGIPDLLGTTCTDNVNSRNNPFPKNPSSPEWDNNGDGYPDTFYRATNGKELESALTEIVRKMLTSSGTAVSIPTTQKSTTYSGGGIAYSSYLEQATFQEYYKKDRTVNWIGHVYNWWYWGTNNYSTIREDNIYPFTLNVYGSENGTLGDNIISWNFTQNSYLTVTSCEPSPNGTASSSCNVYSDYENLHPIVDFGKSLADTLSQERTIYVNDGSGNLKVFSWQDIRPYVDNDTYAQQLTNWIYGTDQNGLRIRTPEGPIYPDGFGTWKLGDIVYAAPLILDYGNETVVFVASNDGMLHAFYMGYIKTTGNALAPIKLQNSPTDTETDKIGKELWAFIPTNTLPYFKYLANPDYGTIPNKHLYMNDLSPYLVRYNGRLILIGGMRLGGAVGSTSADAINPPDICKNIGGNCGLSEYYAIDITNPNKPKLLWEFSDKDLGYTYSGPGIFSLNGKDYVVFASGPINYRATYDQNDTDTLKLYILDLDTGKLVKKIDTGIQKAFGGRIFQEAQPVGTSQYLFIGYAEGYTPSATVNLNTTNTVSNPVTVSVGDINVKFWVEKDYVIIGHRRHHKIILALYKLWFSITRTNLSNTPYVLTLLNKNGEKPEWVGGNPYIYNSTGPDIEYWAWLTDEDFPVTVTITSQGGVAKGGIIALRGYVDSNGNPQFEITNVIKTIQDANGTIIPLKPITSKVLVAQCHNRWYLFGGTGRWFYKEDDLETNQPFVNNIIFGIPVTCGSSGCVLSSVENVTENVNGTTNPNLGWYITLAPGNSTEELLREKDISDPKILTRTNVVLFSTIRPSYAYCSLSEGYTNFWAMDCASGGTISTQQAQGNIITQLSTSQVVKIPLKQFVSKRVIRNYFGIASQSPIQVILPTPVKAKGHIILWLEY